MKRVLILSLFFIMILSCTVFANATFSTEKLSENQVKILVRSSDTIKVTGYTITKGNNVIVYYTKSDTGKKTDFIVIDLNTVARPYKIMLSDGVKSPTIELFSDIKDHNLRDYIRHLYYLGYVNGYEEDNTFRPDNNITRAEFMTLIARTFDLKNNTNDIKKFEDLSSKHWAYDYVIKGVQNGVIEGYEEDGKWYIKLDRNITLAEASKVINEIFKLENKGNINYDVRFVKHWARNDIQNLLNEKVIFPEDDFYKSGEIDRFAKRGEIVMLLSRALGR